MLGLGFPHGAMDVVLGPAAYGYYQRHYAIANGLIADVGTPENKAQIFGLLGAAFGLGFIVGPALGGIIGTLDLRTPLFIAVGLAFINTLCGLFFSSKPLRGKIVVSFR